MPSFYAIIKFMLKILLFICVLIILFLVFIAFIFSKKLKKNKDDFELLKKIIKRVRYGDINIKVNNLKDKELEALINRLIETIYDREIMIKEYQSTLSDKNLTLEEIIKNEKQMQLFKEEFTAALTHDMKIPVIAELNSLNYLLEGRFGELSEKQKEVLNLMKSSNQELKELIENILETYRLEQKTLKLNLTNNNLNDFLNSILKEMSPLFKKSNHYVESDFTQTNNFTLYFDEFQFKRVIKNIIQNALLYSPEASNITVSTEKTDTNLKIYIKNKGNGISKEDLELIFNKYYTGHSKFRKVGTGLGLYISQQIMLAHNGTIEADTDKDDLTVFILTLPV